MQTAVISAGDNDIWHLVSVPQLLPNGNERGLRAISRTSCPPPQSLGVRPTDGSDQSSAFGGENTEFHFVPLKERLS